jgi:phosphatidylinositol alpha-1,6-mannosyltransferase
VIVSDVRMTVDADGEVYATHSAGAYHQWAPWTAQFRQVILAARQADGATCGPPATGPRVEYQPLTNYSGLGQFIRRLPRLLTQIWTWPSKGQVHVLRIPEPLSVLFALRDAVRRTPYIAVVVADIATMVGTRLPRPSASLLRRPLTTLVRSLVRRADAVIYVTEHSLQASYPAHPARPSIVRSNVSLEAGQLSEPRATPPATRRLIAIGSQQSSAKGHDIAIRALTILRQHDQRYELCLVGGGKLHSKLQRLAAELGISDSVKFAGHLPDFQSVRQQFEAADLLVFPSRSEGLPRALIEGMATGLPAVGSAAGGIPEMLPDQCIVDPCTPENLAQTVRRVFDSSGEWVSLSAESIVRARQVVDSVAAAPLTGFLDEAFPKIESAA